VLILALFALVLYGQTLRFGLVMDDNMVITDHKTVQQGFAGIPTLLTKDSFAGFDETYDRSGQRKTYRPASFISFAIEKQLFNNNPAVAHGINIALYALTLAILLALLREWFPDAPQDGKANDVQAHYRWLPFAATLVFAAHPTHTAVVANIKSRDEIFAMLFALSSLLLVFRHLRTENPRLLAYSLACFALALLSKESAVLMLPIVALTLYFFANLDAKRLLRLSAMYGAVTLVFLGLWFGLVGRVEEGLYAYKLHNPFVGTSFAERIATGFMTLGLYTLKALFPWTLSEGYTYNALPVVSWADWRALSGFAVTAALLIIAALRLKKRETWAFGVIAFFATLVVASNLVVYAGSMFGDRFLYTPSLFAALALVSLLFAVFGAESKKFHLAPVLGIIALIVIAYSVRGFMRVPEWQTDYKLLQADHRSTPESIMTARNYASQLVRRAGRTQNDTERTILLDEAESVISRAFQTDSTADPALFDLLGLSALQRGNFPEAIRFATQALVLDSTTRKPIHRKPIFRQNLASVYVSRAALAINQDRLEDGKNDLQAALALNPSSDNAYINLGMIYGRQKDYKQALAAFQAAYKANPSSTVAQQYIFHIQQAMAEEEAEKEEKAEAAKLNRLRETLPTRK
jgi:tetratricopeptide (TPR) repeat protein